MRTSKWVTTTGTITCVHGGRVVISNPLLAKLIQVPVPLCVADLLGAPIVGCPVVPSSSTKPCTQVASLTHGQGPAWLLVDGQCLLLEQAEGMTDGIPSASWRVIEPGQHFIDAMES